MAGCGSRPRRSVSRLSRHIRPFPLGDDAAPSGARHRFARRAPLADSGAASGGGGGYRTAAREPREEEKDGAAAPKTSDAALLRDQLGRIPGLTGENRAAMVRDYYANGRISYDEMQELLAGL